MFDTSMHGQGQSVTCALLNPTTHHGMAAGLQTDHPFGRLQQGGPLPPLLSTAYQYSPACGSTMQHARMVHKVYLQVKSPALSVGSENGRMGT